MVTIDTLYTTQEIGGRIPYTVVHWNVESPHDSLRLRVKNYPILPAKKGTIFLVGAYQINEICIEIWSEEQKKVLCNK